MQIRAASGRNVLLRTGFFAALRMTGLTYGILACPFGYRCAHTSRSERFEANRP